MTKFKKIFLSFGIFMCLGFLVYSFCFKQSVRAQEDNVDLHIKLEASVDNGATWHNYSGTEFQGGESVNADPGDTVLMRIKIWNTGEGDASDVVSTGVLTNYAYVDNISAVSTDADGNGRSYTLGSEMESGTITQVDNSGTEACTALSGSECASLNFVLSNDFPVGETVITSEVDIASYETRMMVGSLNNILAREVYAVGTGRKSAARIVVNVAEPEVLPQTGSIAL